MRGAIRDYWQGLILFLRTPTLGRSVALLLAAAIVLLMAINVATFVMISRTAQYNQQVEQYQQSRRAARSVLVAMLNAESGQRGFLLAAQPQYLAPYTESQAALPGLLERMHHYMDPDPDMVVRPSR